MKSSTSIGANYREANRAESRKDFTHKVAIVEKEASETQYWSELFDKSTELLAIFTSIGKTSKAPRTKLRA